MGRSNPRASGRSKQHDANTPSDQRVLVDSVGLYFCTRFRDLGKTQGRSLPRCPALLAEGADPAAGVRGARFAAVFACDCRKPLRQADVPADGIGTAAVETKGSVFLSNLLHGEAGVWPTNKSLKTQGSHSPTPRPRVTITRGENLRCHSCKPVGWRFLDHRPTIWVVACSRAFLYPFVVPRRRELVNDGIPRPKEGLLEKKPSL